MIGKDEVEKKSIFGGQSVALMLFIIIGGFFLWTEHRAHLLGVLPYLPYLILLLCPLMHFFMHRGHGQSHDGHKDHEKMPE